jgi:[NiFe] hydrogenase diaphorase moiety small subunit
VSDDKTISFEIDDKEITAKPGQTILEAADEAGVYIPRLCNYDGLKPYGACRVCTVKVNSRFQSACTQPVAEGIVVENDTDELNAIRRSIVDMLFVEGNHFCMFCERSGNCELQGLAYRLGITHPQHPYQFPDDRELDATHPDIFIDRNRCVLCARCVRASRDMDGKHVFDFVGRGPEKRVAVDSSANLKSTDVDVTDKAIEVCPVGALLKKREGFKIPVGQRKYDHEPIGSEIEEKSAQ